MTSDVHKFIAYYFSIFIINKYETFLPISYGTFCYHDRVTNSARIWESILAKILNGGESKDSPNLFYKNPNEFAQHSTNFLPWELPHQVKTQYLHFRFHANYFLLPWKIPSEISRRSMFFHLYLKAVSTILTICTYNLLPQ